MGTDIHIYAEVKKNGEWESAVPIVPHPKYWYDNIIDIEARNLNINWQSPKYKKLEAKYKKMSTQKILKTFPRDLILWHCEFDDEFDERNYNRFAILAGVRNAYDYDFGEPKGLPDDVSLVIKMLDDQFGEGHSHSWITLHELLDFNWEEKLVHSGYFNPIVFRYHLSDILNNNIRYFPEKPFESKIVEISKDVMIKYLAGHCDFFNESNHYYTKIEQYGTYKQEFGGKYLDKLISRLQSFGDPDDVRIVFWFDC